MSLWHYGSALWRYGVSEAGSLHRRSSEMKHNILPLIRHVLFRALCVSYLLTTQIRPLAMHGKVPSALGVSLYL